MARKNYNSFDSQAQELLRERAAEIAELKNQLAERERYTRPIMDFLVQRELVENQASIESDSHFRSLIRDYERSLYR